MRFLKRVAPAAFTAAAILATTMLTAAPSVAQTQIGVQLNGNTLNLYPPAIERAGRVFVPLRGVFEQMGVTVVYENGQINASGRGHNVSLTIGSNQAVVDGQEQILDVAPFILGASTYVPLRFLSQSLGVQVDWDNYNNVAMLTMAGGPSYYSSGPSSSSSTAAIIAGAMAIVGALFLDSNNHPYYIKNNQRYYVTQPEANYWKQHSHVVQRPAYVPEQQYPVARNPYNSNGNRKPPPAPAPPAPPKPPGGPGGRPAGGPGGPPHH